RYPVMRAYYGRTGGTTTARTPAHRLLHRGRPVGLADPAAGPGVSPVACCRSVRLEKFARVDRLAFHEHLVMVMWPRAATGASDESDDVAFFHSLAHRDVDLLQVRVARLDAVAVVEDDVSPVPSA